MLTLACDAVAAQTAPAVTSNAAGVAKTDLVVGTTTDIPEVADLVAGFMNLNPDISVQYSKVVSTNLFDGIIQPGELEKSHRRCLEFGDGPANQARQ